MNIQGQAAAGLSSGEAMQAMGPIQLAAAQGLAVVVVRHERKGGGDIGESARGSSAFGGAVDTITSIRRGDGNTSPSVRILKSISRFDSVPDKIVIELDDGELVWVDTFNQQRFAAEPDASWWRRFSARFMSFGILFHECNNLTRDIFFGRRFNPLKSWR